MGREGVGLWIMAKHLIALPSPFTSTRKTFANKIIKKCKFPESPLGEHIYFRNENDRAA